MTGARFTQRWQRIPVTRLRVGRVILLMLAAGTLLIGGLMLLLWSHARPFVALAEDAGGWPGWFKQAQIYPVPEEPRAPVAPVSKREELAERLAALEALLKAHLEQPHRQPTPPAPAPAKQPPAPAVKPHASMLYVSHEIPATPKPDTPECTLAPGATKLPCIVETAMNSDVEGHFTAKVANNVYDATTGQHLLVPQGSTILGQYHSRELLYGNERLPTFSLTLALPDGRAVDIGPSPVIDQHGLAGLTGKVDQHYWRLFGAVFIGGALRGGAQLVQREGAQAGPAGTVAGGVASTSNVAVSRYLGRALDTRPTIEVAAGQLCNVLLIKPLSLPAMWATR